VTLINYFAFCASLELSCIVETLMHHNLREISPILQCFEVAFVEQPKAASLNECEDKGLHESNGQITMRRMILPLTKYSYILSQAVQFDACSPSLLLDFGNFSSIRCWVVVCFSIFDVVTVLCFIGADSVVL